MCLRYSWFWDKGLQFTDEGCVSLVWLYHKGLFWGKAWGHQRFRGICESVAFGALGLGSFWVQGAACLKV